MGMLKEFKEFAMKGSVIDLATAVIIGAAFGKIVSSLVNDILMPPIGLLLGNVDFKELKLVMREAINGNPAVTWNYGMFVQNIIDFVIIAFSIFLIVKVYQKAVHKKTETPPPPEPNNQEKLLMEIRDLLKKQQQ